MNDKYYFVKLNSDEKIWKKEERIKMSKEFSQILKQAREDAKTDTCFLCSKKCTSFCNSHSIPRFCLENIAVNGVVDYSNKLIKIPLEKEEKGVKEAGIFRMICRECDSFIFRDYEDENKYDKKPSMKMLAEIAIKNYLKSISKRFLEIELYNQTLKRGYGFYDIEMWYEKQKKSQLDLKEYIENYRRAKKVLNKSWDDEYNIVFFEKLNYVVPIAFQSNIALVCDIEGNIINDIYNDSFKYKIQDIQICIFPLKKESIVLMFIDSENKRYRRFYKQFKKLEKEDQLSIINYIMFAYSEDYFFSKEIEKDILTNKELIDTSKKTTDIVNSGLKDNIAREQALKENFDFEQRKRIPNLLLKQFQIRKEIDI